MGEPNDLKSIPLEISVNGVIVTGIIECLSETDIGTVITSHGAGRRNDTHVFHYAMPPWRLEDWDGRTTTIRCR